jgi:hypothetical protein
MPPLKSKRSPAFCLALKIIVPDCQLQKLRLHLQTTPEILAECGLRAACARRAPGARPHVSNGLAGATAANSHKRDDKLFAAATLLCISQEPKVARYYYSIELH